MRIIDGVRTIASLLKDLFSMSADEKKDFYRSKCLYYQGIVELSLVVASLTTLCFIYSDYMINGSLFPTIIPRLSILLFIAAFFIVTHFCSNPRTMIIMDYFLGHGMCITAIWTAYLLVDNSNSATGIIIVNLIWMVIAYVATNRDTVINGIIYIAEIYITNLFVHYSNYEQILALEIPCIAGIVLVNYVMTAFYLDHYRMSQKLEKALVTDPLTQVYNRHLLERIICNNRIRNSTPDDQIAMAMLDIDDFKKINDENGHYTGDLALMYLGKKLASETHADDYVIRYGGEEFVIILRNCAVTDACARMQQFRTDIESADDAPIHFTISVGVTAYNGNYLQTLQRVDQALYKAKNTGKNKVIVI
ncbi:GGDEF domain-containing protein [Butyrivibrio sp. MC2013]|uniref:GGDEF domain-containing protein n=1 Tax=Butyrivibrio sp. MC2013 TaxID=1280686 RepID=UPI000429539B|nr:GGDEF domain-containing protein [Butyrivibrio sp. MC2013]